MDKESTYADHSDQEVATWQQHNRQIVYIAPALLDALLKLNHSLVDPCGLDRTPVSRKQQNVAEK